MNSCPRMMKLKIHTTIDPFGWAASKVVLSYQFVVIVWTNFRPIPTLFCVTSCLIHLWTLLEIPKIPIFPIHLWKFLVNPNISTPLYYESLHLWKFSEKPKISTIPMHLWKFSGNPNFSTPPRTSANRESIRNYLFTPGPLISTAISVRLRLTMQL